MDCKSRIRTCRQHFDRWIRTHHCSHQRNQLQFYPISSIAYANSLYIWTQLIMKVLCKRTLSSSMLYALLRYWKKLLHEMLEHTIYTICCSSCSQQKSIPMIPLFFHLLQIRTSHHLKINQGKGWITEIVFPLEWLYLYLLFTIEP
jgi:hypothetical protein